MEIVFSLFGICAKGTLTSRYLAKNATNAFTQRKKQITMGNVTYIKIGKLKPFESRPYEVKDDGEMKTLIDCI